MQVHPLKAMQRLATSTEEILQQIQARSHSFGTSKNSTLDPSRTLDSGAALPRRFDKSVAVNHNSTNSLMRVSLQRKRNAALALQ